jgi:hypothetical protein
MNMTAPEATPAPERKKLAKVMKEPYEMRAMYLEHAVWFWYKATGPEENMISALHRSLALVILRDLRARNIRVPTIKETYVIAKEQFPPDRLKENPIA